MKYLRAVLFSAIFTGSLYFLYSKYFLHTKNKDMVLSEEYEERKRKPIEAGGIVIAHSNSLIYEKLNPYSPSLNKVNLLSDPEEPIELNFKNNLEDNIGYDSIDDILAKLDMQQEIGGEDASNIAETPTVDDQESEHEDKQLQNAGLKIINVPEQTSKLSNLHINSVNSGYKIQLSSAWSEKDAKNEWEKIQARHDKYLKNAQLVIKKVQANNGKIIYLIMAGNYHSLNQAKLICKKLSAAKQNCIVTK